MPSFFSIEWLNSNSQRAYPLADDATRTDETGAFVLPDDFLVALYFPIPFDSAVNPDGFFVRVVSVFATGYVIGIAYDDGSADPPVIASAIVPRAGHVENKGYALGGAGSYDGSTGKVAIGMLADIDLQPAGQWRFGYADGKLDPDCIHPMIRGVTALYIVNGQERSLPVFGAVDLIAGTNFQLTVSGQAITFGAIEGKGLTEDCACEAAPTQPITTINGLGPGPDGNFTLTGNAALTIQPIQAGLLITDNASQPCCGCAELEALTRELEHLGAEEATLANAISNLAGNQQQFNGVILGSRIGGGACITC